MTPALEHAAPRSLTETIADLEMEADDLDREADECEQVAMRIRCTSYPQPALMEMEERAMKKTVEAGRKRKEAEAKRRQVRELRGESNVVKLFDEVR